MCGQAAIPWVLAAASTGASLYGQKRQADAREDAQREAIERQNQRIALEAAAANRAHQARMGAIASQQDIANRGADQFTGDVRQQLGNIQQDLDETRTRRRENLGEAISRDVAGEAGQARQVGSDVKGRISESFENRGQAAGERNLERTRELADRLASLGAFRELPAQRQEQVNTIGMNQMPYGRERESQAAIDRLRVQQASMVPREQQHYIDTSDPLGQALSGIGQAGLMYYGMGGGQTGPYTTSGGGQQTGWRG